MYGDLLPESHLGLDALRSAFPNIVEPAEAKIL
ncbi:MAG: hypothetical protein QOH24_2147, partial [Verrucomicrobiota bacterium]